MMNNEKIVRKITDVERRLQEMKSSLIGFHNNTRNSALEILDEVKEILIEVELLLRT